MINDYNGVRVGQYNYPSIPTWVIMATDFYPHETRCIFILNF